MSLIISAAGNAALRDEIADATGRVIAEAIPVAVTAATLTARFVTGRDIVADLTASAEKASRRFEKAFERTLHSKIAVDAKSVKLPAAARKKLETILGEELLVAQVGIDTVLAEIAAGLAAAGRSVPDFLADIPEPINGGRLGPALREMSDASAGLNALAGERSEEVLRPTRKEAEEIARELESTVGGIMETARELGHQHFAASWLRRRLAKGLPLIPRDPNAWRDRNVEAAVQRTHLTPSFVGAAQLLVRGLLA